MKDESWKPRPDPQIRKDGRCSVCRKPRPEVAVKHFDPFCSSDCAKRWHKVDHSTSNSP